MAKENTVQIPANQVVVKLNKQVNLMAFGYHFNNKYSFAIPQEQSEKLLGLIIDGEKAFSIIDSDNKLPVVNDIALVI